MRCTEIISERGLKAAELSNRPSPRFGFGGPGFQIRSTCQSVGEGDKHILYIYT